MSNRLSDDFINLTTRLMMCENKREIINIATEYGKLIERLIEQETNYTPPEKSVTTTITFTKKEIERMEKTFKKEFIAKGGIIPVIKRPSGKNSSCYEIRYRSNGYKIEVSSTDLAEAKRKFLEKTLPENIQQYYTGKINAYSHNTMREFALFFFENHRKGKVATQTYRCDLGRLKGYILPAFGDMDITKITPDKCQALLHSIQLQGKGKTADEIYSLLSILFKGAIAYGIIQKSPLAIVQHQKHIAKSGKALTRDEEEHLFSALNESLFRTAAAIALYTGLRPNELSTAKIQGDFITALNSKRKNGKIQYKRIPIIDALRPYIADGIPELPPPQVLRRHISAALPNHKLYDLRTTFYTRCDEYGVAVPARDEFVGHSAGALTNAYRDLSEEYLLREGRKLNAW